MNEITLLNFVNSFSLFGYNSSILLHFIIDLSIEKKFREDNLSYFVTILSSNVPE